jgi:MFS family permease
MFLFLALFTHNKVFLAGNESSRYAQIEALVDYHQTNIDESKYNWTIDRVTLNEKDYSNKPPSLSIIGSGIYFILKNIFGLTFEKNESLTIYLLTLLIIGLSTSWLASKFYTSLEIHKNIQRNIRVLATLTLATGTILTSFSVTFNNHTVAAALIFAAFCDVMAKKSFRAGIWISLAICIDVVPGALFIPVFALMLYYERGRSGLFKYFSAVLIGGILFVSLNMLIAGHPLPPKLIPGGIDHSSQYESVVQHVPLPKNWLYPLQCLFGWHGFFTVSPVLIIGAIGLVLAAIKREPFKRRNTIFVGSAVFIMLLGYASFVGSLGGWSYGIRYLIPIMPILLFFIPVMLKNMRIPIFICVLVLSTLFALIGMYNPWPPVYEPEVEPHPVASLVKNPIGGNFSAWMREYFGESALTRIIASNCIHPDKEKQNQYLVFFYLSKGDKEMAQKVGGSSAEQYYKKGMSLLGQDRLAESIENFEQVLKMDPNHAPTHNNMGIALARLGQIDRAIEHFKIAIRLRPDNQSYQQNLSRAEGLKEKEKI